MFLTFEQQNDLVARGLAKRSDNGNLSTFKYSRKVMYDYLWDKHPELLECRGHTYDNITGEMIIAAPRKTFNYLENGTWVDKPLDTKVSAYRKYNGFMACLVLRSNETIVTTTGSSKSNFSGLARRVLLSEMNNSHYTSFISEQIQSRRVYNKNWKTDTFLFEIIDKTDPHIIDEVQDRAELLGWRDSGGRFHPSVSTKEWTVNTLKDAIELCKTDRGEGFMLYDEQGNCCKMKTEYYIGKKKLMRMSKSKVEQMWKNPKQVQDALPNYWKGVVEYLLGSQDCSAWMEMTDQQRRKELERFV